MNVHAYQNSNPGALDSDCAVCGGKQRDCVHGPNDEARKFWADLLVERDALVAALVEIGGIAENCLHGSSPLVATQTFASPIRNIRRLAFSALALAQGGAS